MATPKKYVMSDEHRKKWRELGLRDELPRKLKYQQKHFLAQMYAEYAGKRFQIPCNCQGSGAILTKWWLWVTEEAYWKEQTV